MTAPGPDNEGPSCLGCGLPFVIGFAVVGAQVLAFTALTGRSANFEAEKWIYLWQALSVAAPFGLLALTGTRALLPWLTALMLTLAFWGYALFNGVSYQWNPYGSGADIGLGLVMIVSPLFIGAAAMGVRAWQRRGR